MVQGVKQLHLDVSLLFVHCGTCFSVIYFYYIANVLTNSF